MTQFKLSLIFIWVLVAPTLCTFEVGWGLYRWIDNQHSLFDPLLDTKIVLSHPAFKGLSMEIQSDKPMTQQFNVYNLSQYSIEPKGTIRVQTLGKEVFLQFHHLTQFIININCTEHLCKQSANYISEQLKSNKVLHQICSVSEGHFLCKPSLKAINISISLYRQKGHESHKQSTESLIKFQELSIARFMKQQSIPSSQTNVKMVLTAISELLNSICLYSHDSQFYLGFCEPKRKSKDEWSYNFKLAPFSISLLADYYYELAHAIYRDFFFLTETKWVYPMGSTSEILSLPEHVQIFYRFGSILHLKREADLLNFFLVAPMLNELGTLHEQLNYREAKKLHPLLLKMLNQKWGSTSELQALKAVYEESLTQDFKFHDYGEKLEQSIGKNAWIYKVIETFIAMLIKHHIHYIPVEEIKEQMQEHFSLKNIFEIVVNDDNHAKEGKYADIIDAGDNIKVYSKYYGYESLLAYAYGLGKVYPEAVLKELRTTFGIKSLNKQQYENNYRYRGDIHAYFNFKIINGFLQKVEVNTTLQSNRKKQIMDNLNGMGKAIGNKIVDDFKNNKGIYTSWKPDGKGKEKCSWLQIVSILFLKWV